MEANYPIFSKKLQREEKEKKMGMFRNKRSEDEQPRVVHYMPSTNTARLPIEALPVPKFVPPHLRPRCEKCNVRHKLEDITRLKCMHKFCVGCLEPHKELFNRCPTCRIVIDIGKYEEYDGCDLRIPAYEDFVYAEV